MKNVMRGLCGLLFVLCTVSIAGVSGCIPSIDVFARGNTGRHSCMQEATINNTQNVYYGIENNNSVYEQGAGVNGQEQPTNTYHIEWGDTLSGISQDTGVSVQKLANQNQIENVDLIYADSSIQY